MDAFPPVTHLLLNAARISAILLLVPLIGERRGPRLAVVALAFWVAYVTSSLRPQEFELEGLELVLSTAGEALVGLLLGFCLRLSLLPLEVAGEFLSHEAGLAMPASLDPSLAAPTTILSAILHSFGILLFAALGGPEMVIRLLGRSFELLPAGTAGAGVLGPDCLLVVPALFARAFRAALELALPVIVASLLGTAVIAVLAKAVPQLNLFTDIYPVRTTIVVGALVLFLPFMAQAVSWALNTAAGPVASAILQGARG